MTMAYHHCSHISLASEVTGEVKYLEVALEVTLGRRRTCMSHVTVKLAVIFIPQLYIKKQARIMKVHANKKKNQI